MIVADRATNPTMRSPIFWNVPAEIKELYHARWGIETAFRELKYGIGLVNLHGIARYTEPVRPGRRDSRNIRAKSFAGFIYRGSA